MLLFWILIFVLSLAVLIKASGYFTDVAEFIGKYFKISPFIIGVTIVAVGTSLPELVSSVLAVINQSSEIVIGNVVGSNIANIFLVLGVAAIISKKIKITRELIHVDLPLFIASSFLLTITVWDGVFNLFEALLCMAGLIIYISYIITSQKSGLDKDIKQEMKGELKKEKMNWKTIIVLLVSSFFIYLGARFTVESVIQLSQILNVATNVIAISAVALGTSLPELVVSVVAAKKGKPEIAVGNILGSNIFNSFAVMAIPAFIGKLDIPENIIYFGLPMMLVATFLYYFITQDKQITRWEGWMLILFYIFFLGKVFTMV